MSIILKIKSSFKANKTARQNSKNVRLVVLNVLLSCLIMTDVRRLGSEYLKHPSTYSHISSFQTTFQQGEVLGFFLGFLLILVGESLGYFLFFCFIDCESWYFSIPPWNAMTTKNENFVILFLDLLPNNSCLYNITSFIEVRQIEVRLL